MGRRRRDKCVCVCVFEGLGERWHERKGVAGGVGGKLNLAQDVTAPGNSGARLCCTVKITTRLRPQYVLPTNWLVVEKVDGISQRRRIPRRLVVDVDVVVPVDATRRESPFSPLDYYLNFHLRENPRHLVASPCVWRRRTPWRFSSVCVCVCVWRSLSIRDDRVKNEHRGSRGEIFFFLEKVTASLSWKAN